MGLLLLLLLLLGLLACTPTGWATKKQKSVRRRGQKGHPRLQAQEWYRADGFGALDGHGLSAGALQCTVERVPAVNMTAETFRRDFDLQRPVILSGAVDAWKVPTAAFQRPALLELADRTNAMVLAGSSSSIPKHHGEGHRRVKLRWLVESTMGKTQVEGRPGRDSVAAFDRGEFFRAHPTLRKQLVWPSAIYPTNRSGGGEQTYFSLGGPGSGVQFHYHADGWSIQYFGRKAWWFYPPGETPLPTYPPAVSMAHWVAHMLPALLRDRAGGPMHCIVEEGEWLYVPEGWYHATFALEDSVSVAAQLGGVGPASLGQQAVTPVQRLWSELWLLSANNQVSAAIEKSNEIMALAPRNREVIYQRALLLSRQATIAGRMKGNIGVGHTKVDTLMSEAVAGFKAAINANPRQAEPYNNYAALVMAGWQTQLHQQQYGGGPALSKLKGLKSVRSALLRATELNPTNANAWENLALLHDYDLQSKMAMYTQKDNPRKREKSAELLRLERQLSELQEAAAHARMKAQEAEAVLHGFEP